MALTISGTGNGSLNNLSLSASTGDILDSANTTFFGVDQWYLNTSHTGNTDITAWTRLTGDQGGSIGSAMSVSSGIWTFPSTGIWKVYGYFDLNFTAADSDFGNVQIKTTNDNFSTTHTNLWYANNFVEDEGWRNGVSVSMIFDCTDTSNDKLKFTLDSANTGNFLEGINTNIYRTFVNFTRLGDT